MGDQPDWWRRRGGPVTAVREDLGAVVRIYTRRLSEVTKAAPELVEAVRALPGTSLVLDGEAIALESAGRPRPVQQTTRRFAGRLDVETQRARLPLSAFFFDVLHVDGQSLLDRPAAERFAA